MPNSLDGFFKVCFILDNLNKSPENANIWIVYLLSYVDQKLNSYELAKLVYCLDFLYSKVELKKNELDLTVKKLKQILEKIKSFAKEDGSYYSDKEIPPIEDTRNSIFCINLIEDLMQDLLFYYGNGLNLKPISKIYENIKDINKTYFYIFSKKI
jgi:hypothetical protein